MSYLRTNLTGLLLSSAFVVSVGPASAQLPNEAVKELVDEGFNAINAGNPTLARQKLEQAVKIDPTNMRARKNLSAAYNNLAVQASRSDDFKEALRLLHLAVYYDQTNEVTQRFFNKTIAKMGKNPNSFIDRVKLGDEARSLGDLIGATVEYNAALKIKESRYVLKRLGEVAREQMHLTPPKSSSRPKSSPAQQTASTKQKYVIDMMRVVGYLPRGAKTTRSQMDACEAELKQLIADANQTLQEAHADGYTASSVKAQKDDIQNYINGIIASYKQKAAAEERILQSILENIATTEAASRGVARTNVKWKADYSGKDAVDITDSVIAKVQAAR